MRKLKEKAVDSRYLVSWEEEPSRRKVPIEPQKSSGVVEGDGGYNIYFLVEFAFLRPNSHNFALLHLEPSKNAPPRESLSRIHPFSTASLH